MTIEYKNWKLSTDEHNILWLAFDRQGEVVNSFSVEVMTELDQILDGIAQSKPKGVVITSAKKVGFIAGADITQFKNLSTEEEAFNLIRQGQLVFDKLESLPMPTVALINGFCLGGGYELALACQYRVALKDPSVKIGLPEIKLGIQPGWGGTVRLPKLIGPVAAMGIILPGRAVAAAKAKKIGMIDAAVPERQLTRTAIYYILNQPSRKELGSMQKLCNSALIRPLLKKKMIQQLASKNVSAEHYPAPYAVIHNWEKFAGADEEMLEEAKSISRLMMTPTAHNLLRVFFLQNKMKELARGVKFKAGHVHVIGAGTMGGDIAAWCALRGMHVTLQDQSPERIAPAIKRAYKLFKKKLRVTHLVQAAMDRLQPDVAGSGVSGADVIIEAVFENLEVKQQIFKKLEATAKPTAILASNTSSIPLEEISQVLDQPNRLVGIHFFNPVSKMPLVEIVHTRSTPEELIKQAACFIKQISRSPLAVLSRPGFLVNRVLMPYLMEAMVLYQEGATIEQIDRAALNFGMPMGPIELADTVGLDVCLMVAENLMSHFGGEVPSQLADLVKQGHLGVKAKEGFYYYNQKNVLDNMMLLVNKKHRVRKQPKENTIQSNTPLPDIADRLIFRMLNEAVACLDEGIVSNSELLDAGMIFGTGFAPFTGGPINYAVSRGVEDIVAKMQQFARQYGERFTPHAGWEKLLNTKQADPQLQVDSVS